MAVGWPLCCLAEKRLETVEVFNGGPGWSRQVKALGFGMDAGFGTFGYELEGLIRLKVGLGTADLAAFRERRRARGIRTSPRLCLWSTESDDSGERRYRVNPTKSDHRNKDVVVGRGRVDGSTRGIVKSIGGKQPDGVYRERKR